MKFVATELSTLDWGVEVPVILDVALLQGKGERSVKINTISVLNNSLRITVPSFYPGGGDTTPGIPSGDFTFMHTGSASVKAGNYGVLREGDESIQVSVAWNNQTNQGQPPRRESMVTCKIQSAGQTKVSAN